MADPDKNVPSREPVHELCEQLDLLRAVTSAHSDALFVKNLAGVYLYCNEAASRFVGRSCSEIVGRTDAELLEPEAAERIRVQDRRVAVTEKRETEDHIITVAGKPCLFETSKMPYRNSIGEVACAVMTLDNVPRCATPRPRWYNPFFHPLPLRPGGRCNPPPHVW